MRAASAEKLRVRRALARWRPSGRRWRALLADPPLTAEALQSPPRSPGCRDFIICGAPRTGTTLLCGALFQPPRSLTVTDPWPGALMEPADLFRTIRGDIDRVGWRPDARLAIEDLRCCGRARRMGRREAGGVALGGAPYHLGVRWPDLWSVIPFLPHTRFLVCVRNPFDVVALYKTQGGRLATGLAEDTPLHQRMNERLRAAASSIELRRILLYEYVHTRLLPLVGNGNVKVVRYERWLTDPEALVREIASFLEAPLGNPAPQIRHVSRASDLTYVEHRLIRENATAAAALGYLGAS